MAPTVYLVSGANRGIGLGIVTALAMRPDVVVFAGTRNPATSSDLSALETKYPDKVHTVKLNSADRADIDAAIAEIKRVVGKLDVIIANAGIAKYFGGIADMPLDEIREHFEVNVVGPTVLFQSAWPLLKASSKPEFVVISSAAGSIAAGAALPVGFFAYGVSKAGVNYLAMKLHSEHPELVVVDIHPGPVQTDMGSFAQSQNPGLAGAVKFISVEESVTGIMKLVDYAKRDAEGPKMIGYDGFVFPW
ncbi:NAD(P)-binding protein [Calocera viscosa TUFC12733]|uniref:NAD(P)-binding protein n=1 Tax=Calocera viscosa (strain TUFC12733) TaxID=1330018 RepID=A0A167I7I4_CALVF|nr:NAD(P)-binding protein [Calocera viscosa TUFC12733]